MGTSRDKLRSQSNADLNTGSQLSVVESPDLTPHLEFSMNVLQHVSPSEIPDDRRRRSDMEKEREMRDRFGPLGPGERLTKSSQETRRDMLQEQQDVDGLPWEVRWKKTLIPTSEEVVQDIRDRFDLYVQDPIEREQEWYLHWKDRGFKIQKDRMIWPQGYTDYLDHYDVHGRRRVLPTDQRWSDTSWKHLADTRYRDRMWLIEGEERKAVHRSMQSDSVLMEEEEQRLVEMGDVYNGIVSGVLNFDPEQTYEALSGTADPLEVAKTKMKLNAYGAKQAFDTLRAPDPATLDPVSGFPKADMEPLPTGITVEQGAAIAAQAHIQHEMMERNAEVARQEGYDPTVAMMKSYLRATPSSGQPLLRAQTEARIERTKEKQAELDAAEKDRPAWVGGQTEKVVGRIEQSLSPAGSVGETMATQGVASTVEETQRVEVAEGFIEVARRPMRCEPDVPADLYATPQTRELDQMPQWYRETLVETTPLIAQYGMVQDPLEMRSSPIEYYEPPSVTELDRITNDDAIGGTSAFDEAKMHKLRSLPELVEGYKPLPLFREVIPGQASKLSETTPGDETGEAELTDGDGRRLKKSEQLRRERQKRLQKANLEYDSDILLPSLPWETDSVTDPYRGVKETDAVEFDKEKLEEAWRTYRGTFQQCIVEFGNLTQTTSEDRCEAMLFDTAKRFREGHVGEHPAIPEEQEAVLRLVFEAHTKHFIADFYRFKGSRIAEANAMKAEADEILRRASGKCKLLGRNFMNFIQEMTALELDTIRKNPVQRYAVMLRDRKYEPIVQPFMKWVKNELSEFIQTDFEALEQLETHLDFLIKHANDAKFKCPMRLEGVSDAARDAAVEAFFQWCRGALCYYAAKRLHRLYIHYADTRFRSRAEELFEDSIEWFSNYGKASKDIVYIPIPDSDPPYEYDEKEFLDGESAVLAEMGGQLDKAEGLWHTGSSKRWYPLVDETEYMWFNERRGRLSLALDLSDRCLESVNKKTHPSVHPFPERARLFLEGAPLTQETAEHLWLRHMGDLYWEHSDFMIRQGRFQTGQSYRKKCLNFYHVAIRTARERLPSSWKAPLLTEAKYLMRSYEPGEDVSQQVRDVEMVVTRLCREREPAHWVEPFSELPYRLALVHANLPAYGELITRQATQQLTQVPSHDVLLNHMECLANGDRGRADMVDYMRCIDAAAEELFRGKVLRWRASEVEGSDAYLFWTHLYFAFRVHPSSREAVQRYWDMYEPAYLYIYTQSALALRQRGERLINDALRRMCQILLPGDAAQQTTLLTELTRVQEKMVHLVDRRELERTIHALERHMKDPSVWPYTYGTGLLYREAQHHERIARNPVLRSQLSTREYADLLQRKEDLREHSTQLTPQQAASQQGPKDAEDEALGSQPDPSFKQLFGAP